MKKFFPFAVILLLSVCIIAASRDAGEGFSYKNVSTKPAGAENYSYIIGEIENNSGRDCDIAKFLMAVYNNRDELLDSTSIFIRNLPNRQTRSFKEVIQLDASQIAKVKITFESCH